MAGPELSMNPSLLPFTDRSSGAELPGLSLTDSEAILGGRKPDLNGRDVGVSETSRQDAGLPNCAGAAQVRHPVAPTAEAFARGRSEDGLLMSEERAARRWQGEIRFDDAVGGVTVAAA